jgi:C4-type Zn-finger protein
MENRMIEFFTNHMHCPHCGALAEEFVITEYIEQPKLEYTDVMLYECTCENCGSKWDDYYKLVGHGNLKIKNNHLESQE